ncbi:MAG: hypothetical protein VYD78_05075 [Gemmatimonadota bacterium]|nr:hypothetical protein [Gemmatimonadota bacterium]
MLSVRGLTLTSAIVWGGLVLLMGLANSAWPPYGEPFLGILRSIYPGYGSTAGFGAIIVGTIYAALDGAIGGAIFAWLYNKLSSDA